MSSKRPIQNAFGDDDDEIGAKLGSQRQNGTPPKKPRIDQPPSTSKLPDSVQAQVAAAKARIQAQMSALTASKTLARPPTDPPTTSLPSLTRTNIRPPTQPLTTPASNSIQAQLEAARARVQAQMQALNVRNATQKSSLPPSANTSRLPPRLDVASTSKTPTGIHPLLLDTKAGETYKAGGVGRGSAAPPESNPYLQASQTLREESSDDKPKGRSMHKSFQFHKPGRHIREAEEVRREQQMEALKRRIQESALKAGMQDDLTGEERLILRKPPPEIEWWDASLLANKSYEDVCLDHSVEIMLDRGKAREVDPTAYPVLLHGQDSPIDHYIQHPIPIPAPSDKIVVAPKGVILTKKEQKKMRRQRRQADLQDKRDRIKMGLLPPDPPRVKLSNLMRVLTSEAVSDPTKVEARVRREIAARKEQHEKTNLENKLTDEQRRAKIEQQKEADESKGVSCQVYKIKHLISPSHKFKIRKNAQDHNLTGITVFNPQFALVVVEGGAKGLKAYRRLMMVRIDWTDPGRAKDEDADEHEHDPDSAVQLSANATPVGGSFKTLRTSADDGIDWSVNTCQLVFEGPLRQRNFTKGFRALACPTDHAAREALGPHLEGYWDVAKRATVSQDEGL